MKQWKCVQVNHHNKVGEVIEKRQRDGWHLHTYTTALRYPVLEIRHYLLFEKGSDE